MAGNLEGDIVFSSGLGDNNAETLPDVEVGDRILLGLNFLGSAAPVLLVSTDEGLAQTPDQDVFHLAGSELATALADARLGFYYSDEVETAEDKTTRVELTHPAGGAGQFFCARATGIDSTSPVRDQQHATGSSAGPATVQVNVVAGDLILVMAQAQDSDPAVPSGSGYTLIGLDNNLYNMQGMWKVADTTDDSYVVSMDLSGSQPWGITVAVFAGAGGGGGGPSITSVDTLRAGETATIAGTGFDASGNSVDIDGIAQTITSESATAIEITVVRADIPYGVDETLTVTTAGSGSDTDTVQLLPQTGWDYVVLVDPLANSGDRITAVPDLAGDDEVAWDTVGGLVTVNDDGSFDADVSVDEFDIEVWDAGDETWGDIETQTIATDVTVSLTGASASPAAGSIAVSAGAKVGLTGVSSTAGAGSVTISASAIVPPTGIAATAAAGNPGIFLRTPVSVPATSAGAAAGDIGARGDARSTLSGAQSNAAPGDVTTRQSALVTLTGLTASGAAGEVTVATQGGVVIAVSGVAATSAPGDPAAIASANVPAAGVAASVAAGTPSVLLATIASAVGVAANANAGQPIVSGVANVAPAGVSSSAFAGELVAVTRITVAVPGVSASGVASIISVVGTANVPLTSAEAQAVAGVLIAIAEGQIAPVGRTITIAAEDRVVVIAYDQSSITIQ